MIRLTALEASAPDEDAPHWPWILLTAHAVVAMSFWLPADAFFAVLLVAPMLCMAGLEAARSFAEQVAKHRQVQLRAARRRFLSERKA